MPIQIHGKSYNTVAERIVSAGDDLVGVETEVLYTDPVVIRAIIRLKRENNICTFSGISAANASKQIEKESPYEVAETSAVGRALAFAGYETTNGIASAEEMKKADRIIEPINSLDVTCSVCGSQMVEREGTNKDGKKWHGYFCPKSTKEVNHPPRFI